MSPQGGQGIGSSSHRQNSWFAYFVTLATSWLLRVALLALLVFVLLGALTHYVVSEHGQHLLAPLPLLMLLALLLAGFGVLVLLRGRAGKRRADD